MRYLLLCVLAIACAAPTEAAPRVDPVLHVLVLYTPAARQAAGGAAAIRAQIDLAIAQFNTTVDASLLNAQVVCPLTKEVAYTESGNFTTDLLWLRRMQEPLRRAIGGDLVVLVTETGTAGVGGQALNTRALQADAYCVVRRSVLIPWKVLVHECGHLLGCQHQPEAPTGTPIYPYAFAHTVTTSPGVVVGTIVSSPPPGVAYGQFLAFSTPLLAHNGQPIGIVNQRDNARVVGQTLPLAANWRTRSSTPWRNPVNALDVNADGVVSPIDALLVLNEINARGARLLPAPSAAFSPAPFFDVNGDGYVSPVDALLVINALNG
jgi:hypothetical protein